MGSLHQLRQTMGNSSQKQIPLSKIPPKNSSYIYKNIFKDKNFFTCNMAATIRHGIKINLWYDNWIQNKPLHSLLVGPLPKADDTKTVSSILTTTNGNISWNLNNLFFPIPPSPSKLILNITLPLDPSNTDDSIYWSLTNTGCFTLSQFTTISTKRKIT